MNTKRSTLICRLAAAIAATLCTVSAAAETAGKPMVYTNRPPDGENTTRAAREAFGERFTIAPIASNEQFVPAKMTRRTVHPYIREVGRVTIAAVADVNGRLRNPVVVESTNPRLHRMMLNSVRNYWICEPAQLNGAPVRTVTQSTIEVRWRKPVRIYSSE